MGIVSYKNITITGGTVKAIGSCDNAQMVSGICARNNLTISGGSVTAEATGNDGYVIGIVSNSGTLTISGGTTKAKGSTAAVYDRTNALSIDTTSMTIAGAKYGTFNDSTFVPSDSYISGTTKALVNTDTGYVTISPSTPTGGSGNNNSGNTGDSNNKKVVNTSVK